jgi:glutaredoxin
MPGCCLRLLLLVLMVSLAQSAVADFYRYVGDDGTVYYTDKPVGNNKPTKIELQINSFTAPKVESFKFDSSLITGRPTSSDVILYSTTWCGYCKKARRYFQQQRIPFEEYDVEKSSRGKADYKAMQGRGVPIILVGEKRMNGFSKESFDRLYGR